MILRHAVTLSYLNIVACFRQHGVSSRGSRKYLADVAVDVEVLFHGDDPDGVGGTLDRRDPVAARRAFRRENLVEVVNTVDLVVKVDGEGNLEQVINNQVFLKNCAFLSTVNGGTHL